MQNFIIPLIYILTPIIVILLFTKYRWAKKVGTVIIAYAIGILISLFWSFTQTTPTKGDFLYGIQETLQNITVLLAIPLMLFNSDFKLWSKTLPKTFQALLAGLLAVVIAVIGTYCIWKYALNPIDNMSNVSAMMTGIYTGGTMNYYALGKALHIDETLIVMVLTFQMVVTFPFILFLTAGGYRFFRKILPTQTNNTSLSPTCTDTNQIAENTFERYSDLLSRKNLPKIALGLLLSIICLGIGAGLSLLLTKSLNELVVILTITTLAIALSFNKKIRNLPKTFEMGMFFVLIFSVVVASKFNISAIQGSILGIMGFVFSIMSISVLLHLLLCRLFKVNGDLFTVAIVGMFCSPPFIPPIVSAMKNKTVLISGITIGLIGYAVGTYLGIALAYLLPLF